MVRRRGTLLLVLLSASVSILFTTFVLRKAQFSAFNHRYFNSTLIQAEALAGDSFPIAVIPLEETECSRGSLVYDDYCVISPFINDTRITSKVGLVTLCTQGSVEYLKHVAVLCHRWSNPISVAIYSPQDDYEEAYTLVRLLRQCDPCIRYWVNWHFFFPKQTEIPSADEFQLTKDCSYITSMNGSKKRKSQGTYPINVGRNLARQLSRTPYVFSIDIELYPSLNIPYKFERMLQSQPINSNNHVWVIPVFEVYSKYRAPLLKSELRDLYNKKIAISFHRYRCNICHRIPNVTQWISHNTGNSSEIEDSLEPLRIWSTVKRNRKFKLQEWEPFFIGTNKDPEFDVRLSWEGKQNKMQMAYEMCMRNYDFHIVENAFLVHSPGINVYNATKEKFRVKYVNENSKVMREIKKNLKKKYGSENDC